MVKLTSDMRVMGHECDLSSGRVGAASREGVDIGDAATVFGVRLATLEVGPSLGEDILLGAYDRWQLIDRTPVGLADIIAGELRDDASGLTIHVDTVDGIPVGEELEG